MHCSANSMISIFCNLLHNSTTISENVSDVKWYGNASNILAHNLAAKTNIIINKS